MFRVLSAPGNIQFDAVVGGVAITVVWTVGTGVVSGSGAPDDLLAAMQAALIAGGVPAVVTLNATTWRVSIDVGVGNTLSVSGGAAATTCDLHLFGFDQGVTTAAAQTTTAPQAPLGTWASPVPLGGGYLRRRVTQGAQVVSVSGRVVSVKRSAHLSTSFEFTDVPEASVFHSGAPLGPTVHDADAFERFWENINDGAEWQYSLDRTVRTAAGVWVMGMESEFIPTRRIDGWPFYSFNFDALEYVL
tara:strand:- start:7221 stop:7958 length:738 start_codon:yes stop_codon:yes gene_type:complete